MPIYHCAWYIEKSQEMAANILVITDINCSIMRYISVSLLKETSVKAKQKHKKPRAISNVDLNCMNF